MKSLTLNNIDDELLHLIQEKSQNEGKSLDLTIQSLLYQALGLEKKAETDHKAEYLDFFGAWTAEDEKEFLEKIAPLHTIVPDDWE